MFGKSYKIFRLFGFEVNINPSWFIIAVLITWSLAKGFFPSQYEDLSEMTYWWMGVAGAIGLFISIILHELSHSLIARKYGLPIKGITLFIFGGVAQMNEEPPSAKAEFFMAIAGPLASIAIGVVLLGFNAVTKGVLWSEPAHAVIGYLALINLVLAGFNLIPAFPLDGGRVLRSALWAWKNNLKRATEISSNIGSTFGTVLIVLGVINFLFTNFISGIWWVMIGMFIRFASKMSYNQLLMRRALEGESVSDFMKTDPVKVEPSVSLNELLKDYIYKYHFKMFPVVKDSKVIGCVTTKELKEVPDDQYEEKTVGDIANNCTDDNSISPDADAVEVFTKMKNSDISRLMVVENNKLVGIITLKDMLNFLSLKVDLDTKTIKA